MKMAVERLTGSLGEILLREGLITHDQLEEALRIHKETTKSLGRILVEMGVITESVRMSFLKKKLGYEMTSLDQVRVPPFVLTQIPFGFAFKHHVAPIKLDKEGITVAMEDPSDILLLDDIKSIAGMRVRPVIASSEDIAKILDQYPKEFVEAARERGEAAPLWYRIVRYATFPILCFLPLFVFILVLYASEEVQALISGMRLTSFDFFLYIILAWGIWALVMFEINGIVFGKRSEEGRSEETSKK
jgi:hypothetical protein